MKVQKLFIVAAIFSGLVFFTNVFAEDVIAGAESNLENVTCWEISTLPDEDAAYALVLLYGYKAGKSNQPFRSQIRYQRLLLVRARPVIKIQIYWLLMYLKNFN